MNQTILLVGGTRGTGLLIAKLLERKGHGVRALARNPVRAAARLGSAVEVTAYEALAAGDFPRSRTETRKASGMNSTRTGCGLISKAWIKPPSPKR